MAFSKMLTQAQLETVEAAIRLGESATCRVSPNAPEGWISITGLTIAYVHCMVENIPDVVELAWAPHSQAHIWLAWMPRLHEEMLYKFGMIPKFLPPWPPEWLSRRVR